MTKKLTLLAMAAGALVALMVPASAGAIVLTDAKNGAGNPLPAGTTITVTGSFLKTTTALGTIECSEVDLKGEITKVEKSKDLTEGKGLTGSKATGCTFQPGGQPAEVTAINIGALVGNKMNTTASFSYTAKIPVGGKTITCEFETPTPSSLEVTTNTHIAHVEIFLESELCGESEIHGTLTFETTDGETIEFSEGK